MRGGLALEEQSPAAVATGSEFTLRNPHPLAETLPGVYREAWLDERRRTAREPFGTRFLSALDTVLAPVLATIDSFDGYLDPGTTPEDFLAWLGEWVAAPIDAAWPEDRRRAFVAKAAELYRRRGTAAGLRDHIQIHTGGIVEVVENGASSWSPKADGKLPGSPEPVVVIRITVDDPSEIDSAKLEALVRISKPAHVVHRVEIIGTAQRASRKAKATAASEAAAAATSESESAAEDDTSQVPRASSVPAASVAATPVAEVPAAKAPAGQTPAPEAKTASANASGAPAAEAPQAPAAETPPADESAT